MHEVNNNLPGSKVVKKDNSLTPGRVEDFLLENQLPKSIWPDVLEALYLGHDVNLNNNNNILDTDINLLEGDTPIVDLGEYPI